MLIYCWIIIEFDTNDIINKYANDLNTEGIINKIACNPK